MVKVDQGSIPGIPGDEQLAQDRVNSAVLAVMEAERTLRLARAEERRARGALAGLKASSGR